MDTNNGVKNIVTELLINEFSLTHKDITDTTTFDDLGADSLDILEFVLSLEEEFKIDIPDKDLESLSNVGDIVQYIETKINY